jgi:hypothetical protein
MGFIGKGITGAVETGKIINKYFDEGVKTLGDVKDYVEDLISKGIIFRGSDLEKMSPEDLMAAKAQRDRILLETETNKPLNIQLTKKEPEVEDIFADEIVQTGPSQETLDNPFFGSFYKDNIDYMDTTSRRKNLIKMMETPEPQTVVEEAMKAKKIGPYSDESIDYKTRYAISAARDGYLKNKLDLIKKDNPSAIPTDMASFNNFMMALEKEASELININNLDELPEVTSSIPDFKIVPKTKKQSLSEFTGTSFQEDYKNRIYSIWKDKIPDIRAGHELMITRRREIGDENFLNQVKYPVFFTNSTRNSAHIRLENALVQLRDEKIKLTSSLTPLRIRNSNRIKEIDRVIKNIKHDMKELGLETRLYDPKTKKFKKYGQAYESPTQLYNSMQKKQKLNYLGSSDDISQKKPAYVSFEEEGVFLPEGYQQGGFASIEEVLEY